VVAGEVRSLAQRSAQAAKEIEGLITESVSLVETGSGQVSRAGETMQDIVNAVTSVTDIMAEISVASQEQSKGIDQVGQAINSIDNVTQQNAALVEQATAAAASLVCGYGLLVALLLMPTSRFGYLLYPLAFLAWAPALARPESVNHPRSWRTRRTPEG